MVKPESAREFLWVNAATRRTTSFCELLPSVGGAQLYADMMGGRIPVAFAILNSAMPLVKSGKLKALAVLSSHRLPALPDVPRWPEADRLAREKEVLGFFISGHPLNRFREDMALFEGRTTTATLKNQKDQKVELACVVTEAARQIVPITTVQNRYNVADREWEGVLDHCDKEGIGFIPWYPLAVGELADAGGPLADAAKRLGAAPSQVALAWLLRRSPVMLPIPGTSRVAHLEENVAAATLELTDEEFERISEAAGEEETE